MQPRLHHEILNHAPDALSTLDEKSVNDTDEQGLSYLQLATRENMHKQVLTLLRLGADIDFANEKTLKTPLYIAIEYDHQLLANILLACGANKIKAITLADKLNRTDIKNSLEALKLPPELVYALLLAEIESEYSELIPTLSQHLTSAEDMLALNGLITYALSEQCWGIAKILMQDRTITQNIHQYTFGFWAAKSNNFELLKEFCGNDVENWLATLKQLHHVGAPLKTCLSYAPENVRQAYKKNPIWNSFSPAKLSPILQIAYDNMSHNAQSDFRVYCETEEEFNLLLQQAVNDYNFIAYESLSFTDFNYNMANVDAKTAYLFRTLALLKLDVYDYLENSEASKFADTNKSILYNIFSHGLRPNELPTDKLLARARYFNPDKELFLTTFQRCLQDRYGISHVNLELAETKEEKTLLPPNYDFEVTTQDDLSARDKTRLAIYLNRFKVNLQSDPLRITRQNKKYPPFKDLPPHIWADYILPCLGSKAMRGIPSVSLRFNEYALLAKRHQDLEWKEFEARFDIMRQRDDKIINIDYCIRLFDRLLNLIDHDKDANSGCSPRKALPAAKWFFFILGVDAGLGYLGYFLLTLYLEVLNEMKNDPLCVKDSLGRRSRECLNAHNDSGGYLVGLLYSWLFALMGVGLVCFLGNEFINKLFNTRESFDNVDFDDFVSDDTLLEFNEIKACQPDPIPVCSAHSAVHQVVFTVEAKQAELQNELTVLQAAAKIDRDAEIKRLNANTAPLVLPLQRQSQSQSLAATPSLEEKDKHSASALTKAGKFSTRLTLHTPLLTQADLISDALESDVRVNINSNSDSSDNDGDFENYVPPFGIELIKFPNKK